MSLLSDYWSIVRPKIDHAISEAMFDWVGPLEDKIDAVSGEFSGGSSRPLLFGHGRYDDEIGGTYVTVTNITPLQGTDYGVPEVVFVEGGYANYHQPGPRPFMEKAGEEFAAGEGESILQGHLDAIS